MKSGKRMRAAEAKIDAARIYSVEDAVQLIKETSGVKFDASVEVHIRLGIDPKKSEQIVRSTVVLPHGTGKKLRIAAFVSEDGVARAQAAGATIAGGESLIEQIKTSGKCDFDIAVATPSMMKPLASIARILGQKGLMPNPKTGTIAEDVTKVIGELSRGRLTYKNDDSGNVHVACGKVSFESKQLTENIRAFLESVKHAKPETMKGTFIRSAYVASSMGPSVRIAVG